MITISLPLMRREAEIAARSYSETDNAIDVVWTTGATVRRRSYTWDGCEEFDEELVVSANAVRLGRLNGGAPFLDTHGTSSLDSVIGAVVPGTARLQRGAGLARVQLSRAARHADIVRNIIDGVIRNVSAGYRIYAVEKIEVDGKVPRVRVIDWEPWEISAVPIGADEAAGIRAAGGEFPCVITLPGAAGAQQQQGRSSPVSHAIRMRMLQRQHSRRLISR